MSTTPYEQKLSTFNKQPNTYIKTTIHHNSWHPYQQKPENVTNEQILERRGDKRTLLNNILHRKANWIGHIMRKNCLLHDAIEGQMTEVKEEEWEEEEHSSLMIWETEMKVVGRRTQFLDDLRNRRRYWELEEEAGDQEEWRRQFINRT